MSKERFRNAIAIAKELLERKLSEQSNEAARLPSIPAEAVSLNGTPPEVIDKFFDAMPAHFVEALEMKALKKHKHQELVQELIALRKEHEELLNLVDKLQSILT